jgi:DNA-directed RNA polymerase subunit RPC12/RpoP
MIRFACPTCGKNLKALVASAGVTVCCPKCGARMDVPQPTIVAAAIPEPAPSDEPCFRCPYCGTSQPPIAADRATPVGCFLAIIQILLCFPVYWLQTERIHRCRNCGIKLGG